MGKKNAKTPPKQEAATELVELLSDNDDIVRFDCDGIEWPLVGQLVSTASGMGAMVSFYCVDDSSRFCLSLRVGDSKRAYKFDTAEEVNLWVPMLLKKLRPKPILVKEKAEGA